MSNSNEPNNQSFALHISNQHPQNQLIEMQNTNPAQPIQLRVDPVTDYTALTITIIVSIVTAIISAYVTIRIVTKSNNKLIESQNNLQDKAFKHEKDNELTILTSKNRQDWINTLRNDIAEIISESSNVTYNLRETLHVKYKQNTMKDLDVSVFISSYQRIDSLIVKVTLFLNTNKNEQKDLNDELLTLKKNLQFFCNLNLSPDEKFYSSHELPILRNSITDNINNISEKTSTIIKIEWRKAKNGA